MNPFDDLKTRFRKAFSRKFSLRFLALALVICLWLTASAQAAPGDLDTTFGNGGITPYIGMNLLYANGIALQSDGKILVGGTAQVGTIQANRRFAVVRYLPNGTLDTGFGLNGVAYGSLIGYEVFLTDIASLPNGKIIAVGYYSFLIPNTPINASDMIIAVFSPQGEQEALFTAHPGGGLFSLARDIAVEPDGKFFVVGETGGGYEVIVPNKQVVMKFTENGSADSSFVTVVSEAAAVGQSAAAQPDGKVFVAGGRGLRRYLADGSLDTGFGTNGFVLTPAPTVPNNTGVKLSVQPDGKIIGAATINADLNMDFAVFRYNADGTPDATFGTNGLVITAATAKADVVEDLLLQSDGKIIVVGYSRDYPLFIVQHATLARYNPNGSLDTTFGTGGIVTKPNGYAFSDGILQPDGKILGMIGFRVVRYLGGAPLAPRAANFDFNGDGWSDFAVTRNVDANLNWFAISNPAGALIVETEFGLTDDKIVPADYDGDRKTDVAVFRPSDGNWYILQSANNSIAAVHFGQNGDAPVPADYDGDARADLAVYRQGVWYILNSASDSFRAEQFGIASDKPIIGDFDGDGKSDLAVYRDGTWYAQRSQQGFFAAQFGLGDDRPVASDYDGDAKTDLAVFRPSNGTWYLQNTNEGFKAYQFGIATDKPVPADYNADGKTNLAVYRDGIWYIRRETGDLQTAHFGYPTDRPIQTAFQP
ncbi:MAG TPA: FG-GAP-like repeat-containing protein [Pyrinomonadaceae bacterium]